MRERGREGGSEGEGARERVSVEAANLNGSIFDLEDLKFGCEGEFDLGIVVSCRVEQALNPKPYTETFREVADPIKSSGNGQGSASPSNAVRRWKP